MVPVLDVSRYSDVQATTQPVLKGQIDAWHAAPTPSDTSIAHGIELGMRARMLVLHITIHVVQQGTLAGHFGPCKLMTL